MSLKEKDKSNSKNRKSYDERNMWSKVDGQKNKRNAKDLMEMLISGIVAEA